MIQNGTPANISGEWRTSIKEFLTKKGVIGHYNDLSSIQNPTIAKWMMNCVPPEVKKIALEFLAKTKNQDADSTSMKYTTDEVEESVFQALEAWTKLHSTLDLAFVNVNPGDKFIINKIKKHSLDDKVENKSNPFKKQKIGSNKFKTQDKYLDKPLVKVNDETPPSGG